MLIYDSMRVRDDLKENGENTAWIKEEDARIMYYTLKEVLENLPVEDRFYGMKYNICETLSIVDSRKDHDR